MILQATKLRNFYETVAIERKKTDISQLFYDIRLGVELFKTKSDHEQKS